MLRYSAGLLLLGSTLLACSDTQSAGPQPYRVEVQAADYAFLAPDSIPSGWITFELNNELANKVHELSVSRLPNGIGYPEYSESFYPGWETILRELQDGAITHADISDRVDQLLPDWESQVTYITARGLTSPGRSAEKTLYLRPGTYALECWVKTPDGFIHVSRGMTRPIVVTQESADSPEPTPDAHLAVHEARIETDWQPALGHFTFAPDFDTDADGNAFHNNIHLIRVADSTDIAEINHWLDWYHAGGLRNPAPVEFLGGISLYHSSPEQGSYFSLSIDEPGRYAWIVHTEEGPALVRTFAVERDGEG